MTEPPRRRPLRADAARNRQALLASARSAFERNGVQASLDEIAQAAHVGPGTLYRHFPTRDRLVLAVIEDGLNDLHRLGVSLLDDPDPVAALRRWLAAYIGQGSLFDGLARTLVVTPQPDDDAHDACVRSRQAGAALLARAAGSGDLRDDLDADDVLDLAAGIAWVGQQPDRDSEQRSRLVELVIDGLRAPRTAAGATSSRRS